MRAADARPRWIEREPNGWKTLLRDWTQRRDPADGEAIDPWSRIAQRPQTLLVHALGDAQRLATGPAIQVRCLECGFAEAPDALPPQLASSVLMALAKK